MAMAPMQRKKHSRVCYFLPLCINQCLTAMHTERLRTGVVPLIRYPAAGLPDFQGSWLTHGEDPTTETAPANMDIGIYWAVDNIVISDH